MRCGSGFFGKQLLHFVGDLQFFVRMDQEHRDLYVWARDDGIHFRTRIELTLHTQNPQSRREDSRTQGVLAPICPVKTSASRPDCSSKPSETSSAVKPCSVCSHNSIPGSTVPLRFTIAIPSSGVNPIDVETLRPPVVAQTDPPPPR